MIRGKSCAKGRPLQFLMQIQSKMGDFTCDLVISYYKEKLDWLKEFEGTAFRHIYIYTKGVEPAPPFQSDKFVIRKLENIGRCDHTYVYHIYKEWTNLADVTVFATGSGHLPHKNGNLRFIIPKVFETKDSVFRVMKEPGFIHKTKEDLDNFKIDSWRATNVSNQENSSKNALSQSNIRPFGKWYESLFPGIELRHVAYGGVFAVSKKHIHNRKRAFYKKIVDMFPNHPNPEMGHYIERAWLSIFHPVPESSIYLESDHPPPPPKGGSRRRNTRRRRVRRAMV